MIILQPNQIQVTYDNDSVSCNGFTDGTANIITIGGTPPYNYNWFNGFANSSLISGLAAGSYLFSISDTNGCVSSNFVAVIYEPAILSSSATRTDISCFGYNDGIGYAQAFGGTTPYSYLWSDGQTNDTADSLLPGQYSCIVTDAYNCPSDTTNTITIQEPTQLDATTSTDSVTCFGGSDGLAMVVAFQARSPYTYQWNNLQINDTAIGLSYGVYIVTITDSSGCQIIREDTVFEPLPLIAPIINGHDTICYDSIPSTFFIATLASGGGGENPYTYQWEKYNNISAQWDSVSIGNNYNPGPLTESTYFRVSTLSDYGCGPVFSDSIYVKVWDPLQSGSLISDITICYNTSPGIIEFQTGQGPAGANNNYNWAWEDSSATTQSWNVVVPLGPSNSFTSPNLSEDTWYRALVVSQEGCGSIYTHPMKVTVLANFIPGSINTTHDICSGETADTLRFVLGTNTGGDSTVLNNYQWQQSSDNLSFINCTSPSDSDKYFPGAITDTTYFRLIIKNQCYSDDSLTNTIQINVNPLPNSVTIDGNDLVCKNSSDVYFEVPNNSNTIFYTWSFSPGSSSTFVNNQIHAYDCLINFPNSTGVETLFIKRSFHATGCSITDSLIITVSNNYTPNKCNIMKNPNTDMLICDDVTSGIHYQWGYYEINDTANNFVDPADTLQFVDYLQLHSHIIDTNTYRYWVETWFDNSCRTKSYFGWNPSPLDVDDNIIINDLVIYPNPTRSYLYYKYDGTIEIKILDILGNEINCNIDYNQKYITFNDISNGTYFLILQDKEKKIIKRFIISL